MEFTKTVDMEENNRNWYWNSLENENGIEWSNGN